MQSETADMNETLFSSYAAHDHDPNCADIYADLQSMYLLCKSMHMAGLTQSIHSLTHERTCAQALKSFEDLQSVHES